MCATQREIRVRVVEGFLVETGNVRITTFVIGVAVPAFLVLSRRRKAMESTLRLHVSGDSLVTVKAKPGLIRLFELGVALDAFALDFLVTGNDFAWHYQCLERLPHRWRRKSGPRE